MNGAEFIANLANSFAGIGELNPTCRKVIAESFDAAVAALTAERDVALQLVKDHESGVANLNRTWKKTEAERDAAHIERDASNLKREELSKELQAARADAAAMRAALQMLRERHDCTRDVDCEAQSELEALKKQYEIEHCGSMALLEAARAEGLRHDKSAHAAAELRLEVARLREENAALREERKRLVEKMVYKTAKYIGWGAPGKARDEYMAALEAEHEAYAVVVRMRGSMGHAVGLAGVDAAHAAHAAVEALRGAR